MGSSDPEMAATILLSLSYRLPDLISHHCSQSNDLRVTARTSFLTKTQGCFICLTAKNLGIDMGAPVPPGAVLVNQNTFPGEGGLSIYRITLSTCPPPADT